MRQARATLAVVGHPRPGNRPHQACVIRAGQDQFPLIHRRRVQPGDRCAPNRRILIAHWPMIICIPELMALTFLRFFGTLHRRLTCKIYALTQKVHSGIESGHTISTTVNAILTEERNERVADLTFENRLLKKKHDTTLADTRSEVSLPRQSLFLALRGQRLKNLRSSTRARGRSTSPTSRLLAGVSITCPRSLMRCLTGECVEISVQDYSRYIIA